MWTVTCREQPGKEYVGGVAATWNAGQPDEFTFSAEGERPRVPEFVAAAKAALAAHQARTAREAEVAAEIAALLNAE